MKPSFDIRTILRRISYGETVRPVRDWFVLLSITAILVALSIGWNALLFRDLEAGGVTAPGEGVTAFDALPIESVRAVFEARKAEELRYTSEYRFVDPSR